MKSFLFFSTLLIFIFKSILNAQWIQNSATSGGYITTLSSNQDVLYAGTDGAGGFISSNNGVNWLPARNGMNPFIYSSLIVGNKIYAGNPYGLFLSEDNGSNWNQILVGSGYWYISSIVQSDDALYIGYEEGNVGYVNYTTNNGNTWINALLQDTSGFQIGAVTSMVCHENKVYVGTFNDGVFVGTFNSFEWKRICYNYISTLYLKDNEIYIAGSDSLIKFNPQDSSFTYLSSELKNKDTEYLHNYNDKLYAATYHGLYVSEDGGFDWYLLNTPFGTDHVTDITEKDGILFVSLEHLGIYRSIDGINWIESYNGVINTSILSLAFYNETLYCCDDRNNLWSSNDQGNSWSKVQFEDSPYSIKIFADSIYIISYNNKIYKRHIYGNNWLEINLPSVYLGIVYDFLVKDSYYFIASDRGVFRSFNFGMDWTHLIIGSPNYSTYSLASDDSVIYAGNAYGLYASTDLGDNWNELNLGLSIVSISLNNEDILAASHALAGLYFSKDKGKTWEQVLIDYYVPAVQIVNNYYLAATSEGFIFSTDRGDSWYISNDGLYYHPWITEILYYDEFLFAGLPGRGLWRRNASDINLTDIIYEPFPVSVTSLQQNYPNPFNSTTKIKYSIKTFGRIKLALYDVLGNEIKILVEEEKIPGEYEFTINASDLSSGVYFYRLISNNYIETKKIVLLK